MPEPHETREQRKPGRPTGEESGAGRAALLAAARELLCEQGLSQLTSKAVAARAGVKPTLVNYYFGGRRGLLQEVLAESSGENTERMLAVADREGPPEARLADLIDGMLRGFAEEPYVPRLFFEQVMFAEDEELDRFVERSGRASFDALRKVLRDGCRDGRFRSVDPEIALAAIGGLCVFFGAATPLLQRLTGMGPMTPETVGGIAERAAALILHGLMTPGETET
ncbi:MAG: TetR family transcriptional regulator [Deltaproteobacteria bacterium]|nr:TetR family transcriptional regulator [Deltaproteobacteria bacterium]MBW2418721.1 TetR family transcriptional regulator [Deltaproteobacteria bacterium]